MTTLALKALALALILSGAAVWCLFKVMRSLAAGQQLEF